MSKVNWRSLYAKSLKTKWRLFCAAKRNEKAANKWKSMMNKMINEQKQNNDNLECEMSRKKHRESFVLPEGLKIMRNIGKLVQPPPPPPDIQRRGQHRPAALSYIYGDTEARAT